MRTMGQLLGSNLTEVWPHHICVCEGAHPGWGGGHTGGCTGGGLRGACGGSLPVVMQHTNTMMLDENHTAAAGSNLTEVWGRGA